MRVWRRLPYHNLKEGGEYRTRGDDPLNRMLVVAVVSFVLFLADCVCGAELLPIASASGKPVLIACDPGADTAEMGRYLQRFLSDRGFPAPLQRVTTPAGRDRIKYPLS